MLSLFSYKKIPKKLLSEEAKRFQRQNANPLFDAIDKGELSIFKELVEYDPQKAITAVGRASISALYETYTKHSLEMAKILLENGANPHFVLTFSAPPRPLVVQAIAACHTDFAGLLLSYGASIDDEESGLSARKILDNPKQYVKKLFHGYEQCPGAMEFLKKAAEIKQLIYQLYTPIAPSAPTLMEPASSAQNMPQTLKKRTLPPITSTEPPPSTPPHPSL